MNTPSRRKTMKRVVITPEPKPNPTPKRRQNKKHPDPVPGQRFGRLTIQRKSERLTKQPYKLKNGEKRFSHRYIHYICLCDCGKEAEVRKSSLVNDHTKSCGCLGKEIFAARKQRQRKQKRSYIEQSIWNHDNIDEYMDSLVNLDRYQ